MESGEGGGHVGGSWDKEELVVRGSARLRAPRASGTQCPGGSGGAPEPPPRVASSVSRSLDVVSESALGMEKGVNLAELWPKNGFLAAVGSSKLVKLRCEKTFDPGSAVLDSWGGVRVVL